MLGVCHGNVRSINDGAALSRLRRYEHYGMFFFSSLGQFMTNRPICDSAVYTRDTHPRWRFLRPCALCTHPTRTSAIAISSASSSVTGNHRTRELGVVRVPPSDSAVDAPLRDDMLGQRIVDSRMRLRWRNTELRRFDGAVPMVGANTILRDARALVLLHDAGALAAGDLHAAHVKADG